MPVLATWQAFADLAWSSAWYGKLLVGAAALVASTFVTAAYHLGYPEFRNKSVLLPLAGNGIMSLAYLLTTSPLAPVGAHAVMHVSAVLHGAESTVQLPPHLTSEDVHRAA
jgi:membrane protease YdiL (CAAX protease family)